MGSKGSFLGTARCNVLNENKNQKFRFQVLISSEYFRNWGLWREHSVIMLQHLVLNKTKDFYQDKFFKNSLIKPLFFKNSYKHLYGSQNVIDLLFCKH